MNDGLIIAAIAAGSALLGAAIGQLGPLVQHWLAARSARKTLLRNRYERMAQLAASLSVGLVETTDALRQQSPPVSNVRALQASTEMHTLALLYFPELVDPMQTLHRTLSGLLEALDSGQDRKASSGSTAFVEARSNANVLIQRYASKYA